MYIYILDILMSVEITKYGSPQNKRINFLTYMLMLFFLNKLCCEFAQTRPESRDKNEKKCPKVCEDGLLSELMSFAL